MLMFLLDYVAIGTVKREKMKKKSYWYSSMGGCVWFEFCSVVEGLQVGVKRTNETSLNQ